MVALVAVGAVLLTATTLATQQHADGQTSADGTLMRPPARPAGTGRGTGGGNRPPGQAFGTWPGLPRWGGSIRSGQIEVLRDNGRTVTLPTTSREAGRAAVLPATGIALSVRLVAELGRYRRRGLRVQNDARYGCAWWSA